MRWMQQRPVSELHLSVVTVHELRFGIELAPTGAKRASLDQWLEMVVLPGLAGRILPVDAAVADTCGRLLAAAKKAGFNCELADSLIAATAVVYGLKVATLNRKHFEPLGVELVTF
jgi:predicted nucleic acid-binding protein